MKYAVVETTWGPVIVVASRTGLKASVLPRSDQSDPHALVQRQWPEAMHVPNLLPRLQAQLRRYFEGQPTEFTAPVDLSDRTPFQQTVLRTCRTIGFGETMTYGELAELAGSPGAARAVGSVMASNPLPLIIPCHRVLGSSGGMGGFSAPGGVSTKKRMLDLEARALCGTSG